MNQFAQLLRKAAVWSVLFTTLFQASGVALLDIPQAEAAFYNTGFINITDGNKAIPSEATTIDGRYPIRVNGGMGRVLDTSIGGYNSTNNVVVVSRNTGSINIDLDAPAGNYSVDLIARYGNPSGSEADEGLQITGGGASLDISDQGDGFIFNTFHFDGFNVTSNNSDITIRGTGNGEIEFGAIRISGSSMDGPTGTTLSACSVALSSSSVRTGDNVSITVGTTGGSAPFTYAYDFNNDGAFDTTSSSSTASTSYSTAGTYTIAVRVTDSVGGLVTCQNSVVVTTTGTTPTPTVTPTTPGTTNRAPVCIDVTASNTSPDQGESVTFTVLASDPDSEDPLTYIFDFGDGNSAGPMGANSIDHVYADAGSYTFQARVLDSFGHVTVCGTTRIIMVRPVSTVDPTPTCRLIAGDTNPLVDQSVDFIMLASSPVGSRFTNYIFGFGDGANRTGLENSRSHAYSAPGSYTATGEVYDETGRRVDCASVVITVRPLPAPADLSPVCTNFLPSNFNPVVGEEVEFTVLATDPETPETLTYFFSFGDGRTDTSLTGTSRHTYTTAGTYTASVSIRDHAGLTTPCPDLGITVGSRPLDFSHRPICQFFNVSPTDTRPLTTVSYTATARDEDAGDTLTYLFYFGDGVSTMSATNSVTHQYAAPGVYVARVLVTDSVGNIDSCIETRTVTVTNPANLPPVCTTFTVDIPEPVVGATVTFTINATDPEGDILTYTVDFGDGVGPISTGATATHGYATPGLKTVRATVSDPTHTINCSNVTVNVRATNRAPVCSGVNISLADALTTDTLTITANASDLDGDVLNYSFDFGDGEVLAGTSNNVTHRFRTAGAYTVNVTVTDPAGSVGNCSARVIIRDPVNTAPVCESFSVDRHTITAGDTVRFDIAASDIDGETLTYIYDFGDGVVVSSTDSHLDHTYTTTGAYTANASVRDLGGNVTPCRPLTVIVNAAAVNRAPVCTLVAVSDTNPQVDENVDFFVLATDPDGDTLTYTFTFGDGDTTTGTSNRAIHAYRAAGAYTAQISVNDSAGNTTRCADQTITVRAIPPVVNAAPVCWIVTASDTTPNVGDDVIFFVLATDAEGDALTYAYDFGDGVSVSSPLNSATHRYTLAGAFNAQVNVSDATNTTACTPVTINVTTIVPPVNNPPVCFSFTSDRTSATTAQDINFNVVATDPEGSLLVYTFDFGDGNVTTFANSVTHRYALPGAYVAQVSVRDTAGNVTNCTPINITVIAAPSTNVPPVCNFVTVLPGTTLVAGSSASVIVSATDANGDSLSYTFNYGDGTTETVTSFIRSHTYVAPGAYNLAVSISDGIAPAVNCANIVMTITPTPANRAPICNRVIVIPAAPAAGEDVAITMLASDPDGDALTYDFTFGDGASALASSANSQVHRYAAAGTYAVNITVRDSAGNSTNCGTTNIVVSPTAPANRAPVCIAIIPSDVTTTAGTPIDVTVIASDPDGDVLRYTYNFGDGTPAISSFVNRETHAYVIDGTYNISVDVSDGVNPPVTCDPPVTIIVTLVPLPINNPPVCFSYSAIPMTVTAGTPVTFSAVAADPEGDTLTYEFDPGDGSLSVFTMANTRTYAYPVAGSYDSFVNIYDSFGNITFCGPVTVIVSPAPATNVAPVCLTFGASMLTANIGENITFQTVATDANGDLINYSFDFGDATTTSGRANSVTHAYASAGAYLASASIDDGINPVVNCGTVTITVMPAAPNRAPSCTFLFASDTSLAPGDNTTIFASATDADGDSLTYTFNFGDGTAPASGAAASRTHVYPTAGTFNAGVTVSDGINPAVNCGTIAITVTSVTPPPNNPPVCLNVTVSPGSGTTATAINTQVLATDPEGDVLNYTYDFGDGTTSITAANSVNHTYAAAGTYTVRVTVRDSAGNSTPCATTPSVVIAAAPPPPANVAPVCLAFIVNPVDVLVGENVNYTAIATDANGDPITYSFTFGDGLGATGPANSVNHIYTTAGTYTASVQINDPTNPAVNCGSRTVRVTSASMPNRAPSCAFIFAAPNPVALGSATTISAFASDPEGDPLTYTFNFGDGTPSASGAAASRPYTYGAAGSYNAAVSVSDGINPAVSCGSVNITVTSVAPPANRAPVCSSVTALPSSGTTATDITVNILASDPDGDALVYQVAFGDGVTTTSPANSYVHRYAVAGTYNVSVVVIDTAGNRTTCVSIPAVTISAAPSNRNPVCSSFTALPNIGTTSTIITLQATGSDPDGDTLTFTFNFGDGSPTVTGPANSVSHVYSAAGTYSASASISDGRGGLVNCANTTVTITAVPPPVNNAPTCNLVFAAPSITTVGTPVNLFAFGNDAEGDTITYVFTFGDGTPTVSGTSQTQTHTYTTAGTYVVSVTVNDATHAPAPCTTTATVTVNAVTPPPANRAPVCSSVTALPSPTTVGTPVTVQVVASDPDGDSIIYTINFGDGTSQTSAANTVSHTYTAAGTYTVQATVIDSRGAPTLCGSTPTVTVTSASNTNPVCTSENVSPNPVIAGNPVTFTVTGADADGDTLTYTFFFGDGTNTSNGTGNAVHTYAASGVYVSQVQISDGRGGIANCANVPVLVQNIGGGGSVCSALLVAPNPVSAGSSVNFDAIPTNPANAPFFVAFDFGNGAVAYGYSTSSATIYGTAGTYVARATMIDGFGNIEACPTQVVTVL